MYKGSDTVGELPKHGIEKPKRQIFTLILAVLRGYFGRVSNSPTVSAPFQDSSIVTIPTP